jgi:aldose 1-epimerase
LVFVEVGGGIRTYTRAGVDVLDGYPQTEMCAGGRGQILVPWPNRLGDGRYTWGPRTLQLALTEPDHHNAIHGLVRWANWQVEAVSDREGRASHRLHPQSGWGWILDIRVSYYLDESGLAVTTSVTNAGPEGEGPCPIGIGWHPYLSAFGGRVDDAVLTLPAATGYRTDERGLPVGCFDVAGTDLDFTTGRRIGSAVLDTAFTDLSRDAAGRSWVELAASASAQADAHSPVWMWLDEAYTHLMVFSGDTLGDLSRRRRGLAVEPMTCAPDAFRSGDGLQSLELGQTLTASWGLADSRAG